MTDQTDPAALVKAALERAAVKLDDHDSVPCEVMCRELWSRERLTAYEDGQRDAALSWQKAIRALADDPEAVAEIIEQVKGETDDMGT